MPHRGPRRWLHVRTRSRHLPASSYIAIPAEYLVLAHDDVLLAVPMLKACVKASYVNLVIRPHPSRLR